MDNEYFTCECDSYGGIKLCTTCQKTQQAETTEYIKINVKRWKNRKITTIKTSKQRGKTITNEYINITI